MSQIFHNWRHWKRARDGWGHCRNSRGHGSWDWMYSSNVIECIDTARYNRAVLIKYVPCPYHFRWLKNNNMVTKGYQWLDRLCRKFLVLLYHMVHLKKGHCPLKLSVNNGNGADENVSEARSNMTFENKFNVENLPNLIGAVPVISIGLRCYTYAFVTHRKRMPFMAKIRHSHVLIF